jgi:aspartate aminotransferase
MKELGNANVIQLEPSATLQMNDKAKKMKNEGIDIVNLAGGEPNFDTPQAIKDATIKALNKGKTHYVAGGMIPELRQGITDKLKRENSIEIDPSQIILTPGGKYSLFLCMQALLNPNDEVIIVSPAWVSYEAMIKVNGAIPVFLELDESDNFKITKDKLLSVTTDKTKLVILCSPSNPTGHDLTEEELNEIKEYIIQTQIHVVADEMYEHLIYTHKHYSLASIKEIQNYIISVFGFSKGYAMTGWRMGYIVASKNNINLMNKVYSHSITCVNEFIQYGGVVALNCYDDIERMRKAYEKRRNFFIDSLNEIKGVEACKPEGAFYAWVKFTGFNSSMEIAEFLLDKAHVASVPGSAFSPSDKDHVRFSFAASDEELQKAVERIKQAIETR